MNAYDASLRNLVVTRRPGGSPRLEERPCALPAPGGVMLRVLRAAVCGTDRQILRGERGDRAEILGHEGIAEVVAVGAGVSSHAVGDRVVFNPVNPGDQDEILGHSTDGLFRQVFTIAEAELRRRALVEPAPRSVPIERAVLAEPLGTVVYTHEILARTRSPRSLLIFGAGPIGILHALYARWCAGVARVQIVCTSTARADWLASHAGLPAADILRWDAANGDLERGTEPGEVDAVLVCTPARATCAALRSALRHLARDGVVGLIGGVDRRHLDELPGVDLVQTRRENVSGADRSAPPTAATTRAGKPVRVFGQRGTAPRHLRTALEALAAHPVLGRVFSHRVSLGALPEVLATVRQHTTLHGAEYVKAVVDCTVAEPIVECLGEIFP